MKNAAGEIIYIGKAGNLKRRVSSYFQKSHEYRIERLVSEIRKIDYKRTDTALEALILEAELIKKYQPPYNVLEKDDTSFLYIEVTKEKFPRVLLVRGKSPVGGIRYGPFVDATSIREAYRLIHKIFPFNTHEPTEIGRLPRPCFDHEIGLCPGACVGAISRQEYIKTIRNIKLFFTGKKKQILSSLKREMKVASKALEFEKAEAFRRQIFALQHIQDVAFITEDRPLVASGDSLKTFRIEGYDISNISGTSAVGSMVAFTNGKPDRNEYRKFRIKTISGSNDVGMLKEVLYRRFRNNWPKPDLILVDGGIGQVNTAKLVLRRLNIFIPVVGIAKGAKRKKNEFLGRVPERIEARTLIRVRDEAHRFARAYHKKLRSVRMIS